MLFCRPVFVSLQTSILRQYRAGQLIDLEEMKERVYYFDFLNVIACMAMLALHHNLIVHNYSADSSWWQALIVEVVCYWAVPVFFMLSGATLMRYRERYSTREFFVHRFRRAVVPFVVWSLIWVALQYVTGKDTDLSLFHIADGIIHTTYQPVYWFFIPLFGIYLLMPVLSMLREYRRVLIYLAVLIFIVTGVVDPLLSWGGVAPVKSMQNAMAGPILFAVLGFLYKETRGRIKVFGSIVCLGGRVLVSAVFWDTGRVPIRRRIVQRDVWLLLFYLYNTGDCGVCACQGLLPAHAVTTCGQVAHDIVVMQPGHIPASYCRARAGAASAPRRA